MTTHNLKTWPKFFSKLESNAKSFEIRKDDRNYKIGDTLILKEYDPYTEKYTGNFLIKVITHILTDEEHPGLSNGYCILSISTPFHERT